MSGTTDTETPSVTELHTKALDAIHAAIVTVGAFRDAPDVVDDTTLHQAAKHATMQMDHALKALQSVGVAQVVAATDPVEEDEAAPEPTDEPTAEERQATYAASRRTSAQNTFQGQQAIE